MAMITQRGGATGARRAHVEGAESSAASVAAERTGREESPGPEENFAVNLKQAREALGMSQEAVAEKMQERGHSFHQATVYKIENGARRVQLVEALDLAEILESSIRDLVRAPDEQRLIYEIRSRSQELFEIQREILRAVHAYHDKQEFLKLAIEDYESSGGGSLVESGILEEYKEEAEMSATAFVEYVELRCHILDEGDNNMMVPPEPEGELTLEQKIKIARWELERAEWVASGAESRLEWAKQYLKDLEGQASREDPEGKSWPGQSGPVD